MANIFKLYLISVVIGILSLLARVRILLSSMTVFSDSIHIGSMSPSNTIHFGPSVVILAMSLIIEEKRPSCHSLVDGLMIPYSSSFVTALGLRSVKTGFFLRF